MTEPVRGRARPIAMHRGGLVVLMLLVLAPYPELPAAGSCIASTLAVQGSDTSPPLLHRGQQVTVLGEGFVAGCDDTRHPRFGCSSGEDELADPMVDIELVLLQGQPTMAQTSLAVADASGVRGDRFGTVVWTFEVPSAQRLGRAVLKTEGSEPLPVRIAR